VITGIDYSMTSPALCTCTSKVFTFENCKFFFVTSKKKYAQDMAPNIHGVLAPKFSCDEERFDWLGDWAFTHASGHVFLEGYAFAAKGRVFEIGENTGILKHKLFRHGMGFTTVQPTQLKKFATGKGNAKKEQMYEAFSRETGTDLMGDFGTKKIDNPLSDIVDAYFICKFGFLVRGL
jgi:hypothetical protein